MSIFYGLKGKRLLFLGIIIFLLMTSFCVLSDGKDDPGAYYDPKGKRDPFIALVRDGRIITPVASSSQVMDASSIFLAGILWDAEGNSVALINDIEARVGDNIGGFEVKDIQKNEVVLSKEGEEDIVLKISFEGTGVSGAAQSPKSGGIKRR